jgi:hypothetical protein
LRVCGFDRLKMQHRHLPRLPAPAFCPWAPVLNGLSPRGTTLSVSSPSINLTTPSPPSSRVKPSPQQSPPRAHPHTKTPSGRSAAASQANRRSQNRQNGSARSTISMSTPPRQPRLSVKSTAMKTSPALCRFGMAMT